MRSCFPIIFSAFVLASCGASKKSVGTTPVKTVSTADFPYIESFHEGVRLNLRNDVVGAKKAFEKCLSIRQNDDAVYYGLSQVAIKEKDLPKAISYMQKAYEIDKSNIWYTEEIAVLLYDNQQYEKAIPYFKKLVEYEPHNLSWLYGYGECLLRNGKLEESIKVLDQAEVVVGLHPDLIAEKYNLLMSLKKEDQAIKEVERALVEHPFDTRLTAILVDHYFKKGNDKKGFEYLQKLAEADPENGRAHIALGEYFTKTNDREKAFTHFIEGFRSTDVDIDTKMSVVLFLQETNLKKDARIDTLLNILLVVHPSEAKSYSLKGDQMMHANKYKEALEFYKQALVYEKNIFPIWNQVIMIQYTEEEYEEMFEYASDCLNYFSNQNMVYLLKGIAALETKQPQIAVETLEMGRHLVGKDEVDIRNEFDVNLGRAYFGVKDYANGEKYFKNAMQADPKKLLFRNKYADVLVENNMKLDVALSISNDLIKIEPNFANYHNTRANVNFALGKYDEALSDYEKALLLSKISNAKSTLLIIEKIGDSYFKLGKTDTALEYWKTAKDEGRETDILNKKINTKTYYAYPQ